MFITKQTAGAIITEEPEEELLQDYERVILGDIVQVENKGELPDVFQGEVVYNDSYQLVAISKDDKKLKLTFDSDTSELTELTLNDTVFSPEGTSISIVQKATQLGFIKLHNFQINDKIRVVADTESSWDSFEGTIVNIKNDSLVLLIEEEGGDDNSESENIEIHFNYKGIPPESGIKTIEKVETGIPVGEIIFQSDDEMVISDFVDIDEKNKLYTKSDKKDDYINKYLSSLLPNVNKKKEYKNIISEIETWLKLEEMDKIDYSKTLYKDYLENNFSNEYLLPITSDKRKIYMGTAKESILEPSDDEMYYQILGNGNTINKESNITEDIKDSMNKDKQKDYSYVIDQTNELWSSINSYLPTSDCDTNNINKNTLTVRDNKTCQSFDESEPGNVKGIEFDTRILLDNNEFGLEGRIGEPFCLTGHMRLPYTFRTTVNMSRGVYTVKDIIKNPCYRTMEDIYQQLGQVDLEYDYKDIEKDSIVTICQKQEDDSIIKLTGTVDSITEKEIIMKNINHPVLGKKKKTITLDRDVMIEQNILTNDGLVCVEESFEKFSSFPLSHHQTKENYLNKILLSDRDIIFSQQKLLKDAQSINEIDKTLYYFGIKFADIKSKDREGLEKNLSDINTQLKQDREERIHKMNDYLNSKMMNKSKKVKIMKEKSDTIISELKEIYGEYDLSSMNDSNDLRTAWILSQPDKGLYYYLKYGEKENDEKILKYYRDLSIFLKTRQMDVIQNKIGDAVDTSEYSFTEDIGAEDFTAFEGFDGNDKLIQNFEAIGDNLDKKIIYSKIDIDKGLFETKFADPLGKGKKHNWCIEIKECLDELLTVIGLEISKKDYLDIFGDIRAAYNNIKKIKKGNKDENKRTTKRLKMELIFIIVGAVLVYIQTSIEKVKVKPVQGCITMLEGYPLDLDEKKLSGLHYMTCVLSRHVKTKISLLNYNEGSIWLGIGDMPQDEMVKFATNFLKKYIKLPLINDKYKKKRALLEKEKEVVKLDYSINESFSPPLDLKEKLKKYNVTESMDTSEFIHSLLSLKEIQELVGKEEMLLKILDTDIKTVLSEHCQSLNIPISSSYPENTLVEIHPKTEPPPTFEKVTKNDEEEVSDIDKSRYMLLMKYTKDGEKRIINNQGRCVISNHSSELFLNIGKEQNLTSVMDIVNSDENFNIGLEELIDVINRRNIIDDLLSKQISESDFVSYLKINISSQEDEYLSSFIEELENVGIATETDKDLMDMYEQLQGKTEENINKIIDKLDTYVDADSFQEILEIIGNQEYLQVDLDFNCDTEKVIEKNLLDTYNLFKFKICRIVNSDKKKYFYEPSDIPKTWDLDIKHEEDLSDIFNMTSAIENDIISDMINADSDKSMNIFIVAKKVIDDYRWITNICGSCHALLENHIEYTNKLLRYAIIKMIERLVFLSEQDSIDSDEEETLGDYFMAYDEEKMMQFVTETLALNRKNLNKHDVSEDDIDKNWEKIGEGEKQHIITNMDKFTQEEKEIELFNKKYKLGKWGVGLSDFGKYSKKDYDSNNIEVMDDEMDFEEEPDLLEGDTNLIEHEELLIQDDADIDDDTADIDDSLD